MTAPSLLSLAEVARRLGLDGPDAARRLVQKTGSPYRKVGRATKLSDDDYAALLEALKRCSIPEKAGRSRMSAARFEPARGSSDSKAALRDAVNARLGRKSSPRSSAPGRQDNGEQIAVSRDDHAVVTHRSRPYRQA